MTRLQAPRRTRLAGLTTGVVRALKPVTLGLACSLALSLALGLGACSPADPLAPRPGSHIVLISIDTLRADHLSCYGYSRPTSPFLDAFAQQAVLFETALAPSNNTAPAHMSMFTGVSVPVHGLDHRNPRPPPLSLPVLPELLSAAGYATWGLADGGYVTDLFGFDRGFDEFQSELRPLRHKLPALLPRIAQARSRPTFLFLHTYDVHSPYIPAPKHDLFTDRAYRGPFRARLDKFREAFDDAENIYEMGALQNNFWEHDRGQLTPADLEYLAALYDGEISQLDALIGSLLQALQQHGWYDDAWIVITSDHGEAFGEHGTTEHRQLFQEELHVPLLIRPPGGLAAPRRVPGVTRLLDLAPTLLSAVGVPIPASMEGKSLLPLAPSQLPPRPVLAVSGESSEFRALVLGDKKLILNGPLPPAFFDLARDPQERDDLSSSETAPAWTLGLLRLVDDIEQDAARRREAFVGGGTPAPGTVTLTPEIRAELERLGYVGGDER